MNLSPKFKSKALMSLRERFRRAYRRILAKDTPENDSYVVTIGQHRLKRILFRSVERARTVADIIRHFDDPVAFPRLVDCYGKELWVEFVDSKPVHGSESGLAGEIGTFFAKLYSDRPRRIEIGETDVHQRLLADLNFLRNVGLFDEPTRRELAGLAESLKPEGLWFGYDYTDMLLKNLVRREDGSLCVIDVASLHEESLLGLGLVKLLQQRWVEKDSLRETVLESLRAGDAPPIGGYLAYLELCYLASRSRRVLLREQMHKLQPDKFRTFIRAQTR